MSAMPPPVVVGVGRGGSPTVVDHAAREALRLDRPLHLVHADGAEATGVPSGAAVLAAAAERARGAVAARVPVTTTLSSEPPLVALVSAAAGAALVVVGRAPRRSHPYLRSVTGGVGAWVPVPVLSVPDDSALRGGRPRVVVGFDEGVNCGEALVEAFAVARACGAALTLLATWWHPTGPNRRPLTAVEDARKPAGIRAGVDRATTSLRGWYPDVPVEVRVVHAPAGEALIEASHEADLVVLGRHQPLLPTGSHLGPVARAVLREASCPVLLTTPVDVHRVHLPGPIAQHA
ncbi:universal stress protein [Nocardioides sp. W7]|uniref:universal stress protein n=1 Tax=Nocardioides sp. W7 TaxID=2931390 RepID=UPI001FD2B887|nr:universal stress protein [Nocardioides sp. W7]